MLGVSGNDSVLFTNWIHRLIEESPLAGEAAFDTIFEVAEYLAGHVEAHRVEPQDDIITHLLESTHDDGSALTDEEIIGVCILLLLAGIDTTWSAIGAALWHLAQHPDDRQRLSADPSLMTTATEEFLRVFAPVTMAREVANDTVVAGCPMKQGDRVLLPFPSGNRDPDAFEDPDRVVLDRAVNRHFAFGVGIHRCLGSNLARMELRVALEEWLAVIPDFDLTEPASVTWSAGQVRGPRTLPFAFPISAAS